MRQIDVRVAALNRASDVTFLFTDIESSTPLWELYPQEMAQAMAVHDAVIAEAIERHGGAIVKHTGDGVFAQFLGGRPLDAAADIVRAIVGRGWPLPQPLRVRVGLHTVTSHGEGSSYFVHDGDAFGPAVIRAARVMDSAWGGQILATTATLELTPPAAGVAVEPLGEHLLKGIDEPLALHSLTVPGLGLGAFPAPRTLSARYLNLPTPESPLLGRAAELGDIGDHLRTERLVTIVGPGGIGKTRLAIAAASAMVDHFRHGIVYVEAAGMVTEESLVAAIASATGERSPGAVSAAHLGGLFANRHMLLVLDNLDDPDVTRSAVAGLLAHCAQLTVLVTARQRVRVPHEWVLPLGPIHAAVAVDQAEHNRQSPDVELFLRVAARSGVHIGEEPHDAVLVERICRLCGGVPLALELAAASVGSQTLEEIADDFERRLGERIGGDEAVASAFDRFWRDLGPSEQEVVGSLAVFDGPFTLELAARVAGASPFLLSALRERAVVTVRAPVARALGRRYQLHPVFRAQAGSRLAPPVADGARRQYVAAIGDVLADAGEDIDGPRQPDLLMSLAADLANVRGAWNLMVERHDDNDIERALDGLFRFHEIMGWLGHGADLLATAAASLDADGRGRTALCGRILSRSASLQGRLGEERAIADLECSLSIAAECADRAGETFARFSLGRLQLQNGYYREARASLEAGRRGFVELADVKGSARCDLYLGRVAYHEGDMVMAADLAVRSAAAFEDAGCSGDAARAQRELALARLLSGDIEGARHLLLETLARFERLGDRLGWAESMQCLGYTATTAGDDDEAMRCFEQSLAEFRSVGGASHIAADLDNLALLAIGRGDLSEADRLLRECVSVAAAAGNARIALDGCIGIVEVLTERGRTDAARALLAIVLRDPRLDHSDSGPRLASLERRLVPPPPVPSSSEPELTIGAIADLAVRSLAADG